MCKPRYLSYLYVEISKYLQISPSTYLLQRVTGAPPCHTSTTAATSRWPPAGAPPTTSSATRCSGSCSYALLSIMCSANLPFLKYLLHPRINGVQIITTLIVAGLQEVRGAQHALRRQELVPRRQHPHLHK